MQAKFGIIEIPRSIETACENARLAEEHGFDMVAAFGPPPEKWRSAGASPIRSSLRARVRSALWGCKDLEQTLEEVLFARVPVR